MASCLWWLAFCYAQQTWQYQVVKEVVLGGLFSVDRRINLLSEGVTLLESWLAWTGEPVFMLLGSIGHFLGFLHARTRALSPKQCTQGPNPARR